MTRLTDAEHVAPEAAEGIVYTWESLRAALDKVRAMLDAEHPVVPYDVRGQYPREFGCPTCRSTGPCETRRLTEAALDG